MTPVCHDIEYNGNKSMWFFDDGVYTRLVNGEVVGRISGDQIPNPVNLWKSRCKFYGVPYPQSTCAHPSKGSEIRIEPTEAAFALHKHWLGVTNAK